MSKRVYSFVKCEKSRFAGRVLLVLNCRYEEVFNAQNSLCIFRMYLYSIKSREPAAPFGVMETELNNTMVIMVKNGALNLG